MRLFLDSLAPLQAGVRPGASGTADGGGAPASAPGPAGSRPPTPPTPLIAGPILKGKVGAGFTSIGGPTRGAGGAETVLASLHATLLAHGMVVVGAPPGPALAACPGATPLGAVAAEGYTEGEDPAEAARGGTAATATTGASGTATAHPGTKAGPPPLTEAEVRIAFAAGQWAAQVGRLLHDAVVDVDMAGAGGGGGGGGSDEDEEAAGLCVDGFGL